MSRTQDDLTTIPGRRSAPLVVDLRLGAESQPGAESQSGAGASAVRSPGARLAVATVHLYQVARTGRTSPCRFTPTCSHYAVEAFERHGLRSGLRLTVGRLGRCRPGGPFGSDPVPE